MSAAGDDRDDRVPRGAHLDFAGEMSYGDYLRLDLLLAAQAPRSATHDELLFIIQHQTSELWMKLIIHELDAARAAIARDELQPSFKMLARVGRVMAQLIQSWDVLTTLTPADYTRFRDALGKSSGFQSHQYRILEFMLGNKNAALAAPFRHVPAIHAAVQAALDAPTLYDEALRALVRRGFAITPEVIDRDLRVAYTAHDSVMAAWAAVYRDTARFWDLYELAEELVDLEDGFRQWRFRHVTTVERIIGFKAGTGGTAGVSYLRRMLEVRLFPELWDLRTSL